MANRYFVGGGTGNWNSTTNWSATDGGASGASFPVAADAVFLTAASGANNLTVNVASACLTFDCTGFTGSLTMSAQLTVSGNVTLSAGMTSSGTQALIVAATATLRSNGHIWARSLLLFGGTFTLFDPWTVQTFLSGNGSLSSSTINGQSVTINGSLTVNHTGTTQTGGTTELIMAGTGTLSLSGNTSAILATNLTINTTGTITLPNTSWRFAIGTLKYIAGTVVTGTGTLDISFTSATLNTNVMEWGNMSINPNTVVTLQSDLIVKGFLGLGIGTNNTTINGLFSIISSGNTVNINNAAGIVSGTATLKLTGATQTVTKAAGGGPMLLKLLIDSPGTVTFVGDLRIAMNTMKCVAGTVITPKGTWTTFGGSTPVQKSFASVG